MKKSTGYLDLLRLIATLVVIVMHLVSGVTDNNPELLSNGQLFAYEIIKAACTVAVPSFLMISGILFLNPDKDIPLKTMFSKYIRRILLVIAIFGSIFVFIEMVFVFKGFKWVIVYESIRQMLIGNSWGHMWYLYMLLGLYLLVPMLKLFSKHASREVYLYTLIVLFLLNTIIPFIQNYWGYAFGIIFPVTGIYLFYFLAGYYMHAYVKRNTAGNIAAGIIVLLAIGYYIFNQSTFGTKTFIYIWYDNPAVVLMSLSAMYLSGNLKGEYKISKWLRPQLFGIYIFHAVFINILYKALHFYPTGLLGYLLIPLLAAAVFGASFATTYLARLIPPVRKYLL